MRWGRLLRWGRVGFLRRRLPYVLEIVSSPVRNQWWLLTHPQERRIIRASLRALARRETVLAA